MYTEEAKNEVLHLSEAGWEVNDIVNKTEMSRATVYRILKEAESGLEDFETEDKISQYSTPPYDNSQRETHDVAEHIKEEQEEWGGDYRQLSQLATAASSQNRLNDGNETQYNDPEPSVPVPSHQDRDEYVNPEVEMLRLNLEHERKMEKLRQQSREQELQEMKLRNEACQLQLQEKQLQQQDRDRQRTLLEEADRQRQVSKTMLAKIKRAVQKLRRESYESEYSIANLEELIKTFSQLREQIQALASERDEETKDWLVWHTLETVLATIGTTIDRISRNLFSNALAIRWKQEDKMLLEETIAAVMLNQPLHTDEERTE